MIYILISIILWSSLGIVIRLAEMPVHLLIFFSCIISATLLSVSLFKNELRKKIPGRKSSLYLLILGPLSLANTFSFYYAYKHTTIANAVLTHYTAPVIVAFLAPIFLKEKLTPKILTAVIIASAGLWIMLDFSLSQFIELIAAGDQNTKGILAGLFSGFAYAVLIIVLRVFAQSFNPILLTLSQNLVIALILMPFAAIPVNFTSALWALGIMGIVHSTIAPVLYFRGLREVTANTAAILGYIEPVCAILLGFVFFGESVSYQTLIGGGMILVSGYITIK